MSAEPDTYVRAAYERLAFVPETVAGVPLTCRQREVVALLVDGKQNGEIAQELGVSLETAKSHVRHVLCRFRTGSRVAVVSAFWRDKCERLQREAAGSMEAATTDDLFEALERRVWETGEAARVAS